MSPPEVTKLGIIVVNFKSHALVKKNLACLDLDQLGALAVVVDNYSGSSERSAIQSLCSENEWTLLTPDSNLGFGAGMNLGADRALDLGCTHLLLLNPDVQIDADNLERLLRISAAAPLAMISPKILRPDGSTWFRGGHIDLRRGITRTRIDHFGEGPNRWLTAACLMSPADLWTRVGGFDVRYFMYWEDIELSQRCLLKGGDLRVESGIIAIHDVGGTQPTNIDDSSGVSRPRSSGGKSNLYTYYVNRNRLLFASEHLARNVQLRWLLHTPRCAIEVASRGGLRSALSRPSFIWATLRGCISGLKAVLTSF